jgi:hypothetical protein
LVHEVGGRKAKLVGDIYEKLLENALKKLDDVKEVIPKPLVLGIYSIPDFKITHRQFGKIFIWVTNYKDKLASSKKFWETVNELFELKANIGLDFYSLLVLTGDREGWNKFCIEGFHDLFDLVCECWDINWRTSNEVLKHIKKSKDIPKIISQLECCKEFIEKMKEKLQETFKKKPTKKYEDIFTKEYTNIYERRLNFDIFTTLGSKSLWVEILKEIIPLKNDEFSLLMKLFNNQGELTLQVSDAKNALGDLLKKLEKRKIIAFSRERENIHVFMDESIFLAFKMLFKSKKVSSHTELNEIVKRTLAVSPPRGKINEDRLKTVKEKVTWILEATKNLTYSDKIIELLVNSSQNKVKELEGEKENLVLKLLSVISPERSLTALRAKLKIPSLSWEKNIDRETGKKIVDYICSNLPEKISSNEIAQRIIDIESHLKETGYKQSEDIFLKKIIEKLSQEGLIVEGTKLPTFIKRCNGKNINVGKGAGLYIKNKNLFIFVKRTRRDAYHRSSEVCGRLRSLKYKHPDMRFVILLDGNWIERGDPLKYIRRFWEAGINKVFFTYELDELIEYVKNL